MVEQLERLTYNQALNRLEEIAELVRKKEISLEDSLDLLEESVQLATICNQHIDYTAWLPQTDEETAGEDIVAR
ncbi:MAG: exodeoxyribonuclease VII small subunit [Candidatus Aquicultor secundus]|uniref:Exodeoxyribonuclease VII small subunit n=1 Tax=Candidatus Aquicultor secundus TaxID=1973895 RepID=A0A2M7T638_9ACTN|nr:MAG: exodeoxyribonuclease VII small subunit [Candidatus Aquicultor secundus]